MCNNLLAISICLVLGKLTEIKSRYFLEEIIYLLVICSRFQTP